MKKVGIFLDMFPSGGGAFQYSQLVIETCEDLVRSGKIECVILYTRIEWERYFFKKGDKCIYVKNFLIEDLVRRIFFKLKLPVAIWRKLSKYIFSYSREMNKQNCDLWIFPAQDRWGYESEVKFIGTIHDLMHRYEKFPELIDNGQGRARDILYSNICKYSSLVLVDSEMGKKHVLECYNVKGSKVKVQMFSVPDYILEEKFVDVKGKYSLPEKYLFYPAQFWAHKNHKNLIDAILKVKQQNKEICIVFSGSKEKEYYKIQDYVFRHKLEENVIFVGYIQDEEMASMYRVSCGLVMASFCGPTNIPPLESLYLKVPCAVADVYAAREQLGDSVLYFDPSCVESISVSIQRLWNSRELPSSAGEIRNKYSKANFKESLSHIVLDCIV